MSRTDLLFDAGTVGVQVGTPESSASSTTPTGVSVVYDTGHASSGTKSAKLTPVIGSPVFFTPVVGLNTDRLAYSQDVWLDDTVTADNAIFGIYDTADTRMLSFVRNANSRFRIYDKSGSTGATSPWTAATNAPTGKWARVKVWLQLGASATTGQVKVAVYDLAAGTLLEPIFTSAAVNLGTANVGRVRSGTVGNSTVATPYWIDTISYDPAATDVLTDYAPPNTGTITANLAVTPPSGVSGASGTQFTATASGATGGTGTAYLYAFNWGDGTATTTPTTSATATHTYANPSTYTVSLFVTNA